MNKSVDHQREIKPKEIGVLHVLGWIFGVLITFSGFVHLFSSKTFFGGLLMLFSGLIIIPKTNEYLIEKFNISLSRPLRIIICFILLLIGSQLVVNNLFNETKENNIPASSNQNEIITQEVIPEPIKETKTPNSVPAKTQIYDMNEEVKVDYLSYKVTKAETFTKMGYSFDKVTEGKFVKVYLTVINNGKETKEIFTPRFTIIDNEDRKFDRLSDDSFYITDAIYFGEQLQPSLPKSGAIVFELPKDSTGLVLSITGDWLSVTEVQVNLSKIINIGEDKTKEKELDEMMDENREKSEEMMEDLMNQCNSPFKCSSSCPEYMDVGQKDCPNGKVCCLE